MARHNVVAVTHTRLRQAGTVAAEAVSRLWVTNLKVTITDSTEVPDFGVQPPCMSDDTEIAVALGGDGMISRVAGLVHYVQVPILGVNTGHVGFLAEFESLQIDEATRRVSTHDYSINEHVIAHVDVWLSSATEFIGGWALNDITLECADWGKTIGLFICMDDVKINSFGADGVIISAPIGSTAYALSAGSLVMQPNVRALQSIPLAVYALFVRLLIIGSGSTPTINVLDDSIPGGWTRCDGHRQRALPQGTRIMVREPCDTLHLARLSGVPFTNRLVFRLDLLVVDWHGHARNETSSQSLHHGHMFPAAAHAAGVAVAGDAGVVGIELDKPDECGDKIGSQCSKNSIFAIQGRFEKPPLRRPQA